MKKILLILLYIPFIGVGQTTIISDINFENALIFYGYDTAPANGSVPTSNIESIIALDVSYENITDLTGIEDFIALEQLWCDHNQITSLDVSQNASLEDLKCAYNNLTFLNVKNGNNANFINFDATENFSLTCIEVDDVTISNLNWTVINNNIDPQHYFSNNCNGTNSIKENITKIKLIKEIDLLGRKTKETKNYPLIYLYDDRTVEKRIVIE